MAMIKVSEAGPTVLNWLVAKCEGVPGVHIVKKPGKVCVYGLVGGIDFPYQPATDWAKAGPIIDREDIQWCRLNGQVEAWSGFDYVEWRRDWDSNTCMSDGAGFGTGHSIMVAAMRCYVMSKLGYEAEVPEELLK